MHDARAAKQLHKNKDKIRKHAEGAKNGRHKASQNTLLRAQFEAFPAFIILYRPIFFGSHGFECED
ncbi:hypothetical protein EWM64_g4759 [Hericium alpestre]|uniref:Uncharacterized protein n=1 Tax=Hericium alpestre TaxID=135208 RepID=A0A4Y9ZYT3_9AGAM|nr:hypothetical protein EWM64_g4759 [Hericium alpestre]